ncbi:phosphonatase-like hydrolase [Actinokineospora sp. NBRC 105648]|uniref:phosphonatase-like hydrolase n=1 Tax=Actinokineospora sp. NBRC 105648 TaxID=3032206 RepID=UPI0024A2BF3D|nr:phosphonatase-like hydrolase [Actinokineospora sp. NBRC 105648]GLZ40325.1 phosphonoacetaldehyde hydrolase [Actinokineospora sp. NBRC 105648]
MTIDLVALDMAGTTVQEGGAVYRALADAVTAASGALVPAAAIHRWMGADKREAIAALLAGAPAEVDTVFDDFRTRLAAAYEADPPTALPGVEAALAELRAHGTKVALTTGFSRDIAEDLLTRLDWKIGDTIDALITVDEVAAGRPAPYMIFRAMEATGTHTTNTVLTAGDTVLDLRAGTNAGARYVVGVLTGSQDAETLGRERHTHLLPSVADIPLLPG